MKELEACALAILSGYGDPACHEEMISMLKRGQAEVLEARNMGVMLCHRRGGMIMLAGNAYRMREMALSLRNSKCDILLHGEIPVEMVMEIKREMDYAYVQPFVNYAYYGELPPEEDEVDIRPLNEEHLDFLYAHYGHATREYLAERIADGVMIGAFVDGQQAGFIGEHVEGAMGLLHIMPDFRRHHLGFKLERADIRLTMLRGHTPFCQVAAENHASRSLQKRLGMTEAQGMMYWLSDTPL